MHWVVCIERLRARREGWWGNVTLFGFGRSSPFAAIGLLSTTSGQASYCHHVYFLDLPIGVFLYCCFYRQPLVRRWIELSFKPAPCKWPHSPADELGWNFWDLRRGRWYILLMEQFFWSQQIAVLDLISLSRNLSYILLTGLRELECLAFWYIYRKRINIKTNYNNMEEK